MAKITKIEHEIFGSCLKITNSLVEMVVSLDFGPRVLHFSLIGKENMFYNDNTKSPLGEKYDLYEGDQIILYGGHRIWTSPEILPRCYHPDNSPVTYEEVLDGVILYGAVEKYNNIQKIMEIKLIEESPVVTLNHWIKNLNAWDIELAPWCITMMAEGGTEILPMPKRETGVLANRNISLWSYSKMNDERVTWGDEYITLKQDTTKNEAFKLGYNNEAGWAAYFNKNQVFFKFFNPIENGFYPDNGCCYETYTNAVMLEAETLGEVCLIPSNESVLISEEWELYEYNGEVPTCEKEITNLLSKFISIDK